ncbi:MAG: hypothetical protein QN162_15340 [Armatimonadota bacterium]|nr:hypothetical protein [Armatimonadota bacterium]
MPAWTDFNWYGDWDKDNEREQELRIATDPFGEALGPARGGRGGPGAETWGGDWGATVVGPDTDWGELGRQMGERYVQERRAADPNYAFNQEVGSFWEPAAPEVRPETPPPPIPGATPPRTTQPRLRQPFVPPLPRIIDPDEQVVLDDWGGGPPPLSEPLPPRFMLPGRPGAPFAGQVGSGSSDIDELRAAPWTSAFEQAALAQADELVNQRYQALREQRAQELARRGITPDSGLWQREMGRIDRDAAREAAAFRRNLQLQAIDRRQRNLAAARAIEAMMENIERQRLFDLLAMLSGNPNYAGAAGQAAAGLAPLLGQQAALFGQAAGSAFGNLGDLFALLLDMNRQPPQVSI